MFLKIFYLFLQTKFIIIEMTTSKRTYRKLRDGVWQIYIVQSVARMYCECDKKNDAEEKEAYVTVCTSFPSSWRRQRWW